MSLEQAIKDNTDAVVKLQSVISELILALSEKTQNKKQVDATQEKQSDAPQEHIHEKTDAQQVAKAKVDPSTLFKPLLGKDKGSDLYKKTSQAIIQLASKRGRSAAIELMRKYKAFPSGSSDPHIDCMTVDVAAAFIEEASTLLADPA